MKRQLPCTSSVDEPQRNVRSRNPLNSSMPPQFQFHVSIQQDRQRAVSLEQPHDFEPGVQSIAPNLHAEHQSPPSVSGESISGSSDVPQSLQPLAGSTAPRVCVQCGSRISALDESGNSLSSEVPPPAANPLVSSPASNQRGHIPSSEERSVSLPNTSPVDEPQRNVRSRNPFASSMLPHFRVSIEQDRQRNVSLEQPRGFQPRVQSMAPNRHVDHQSPTPVPGESISGPSDASVLSDPLVPSTAPHLRSHLPDLRSLSLPRAPPFRYTRVILSSVAPPAGSPSLVRITPLHLSGQHQNRASQSPYSSAPSLRQNLVGPTGNRSQSQNPQIMSVNRHRDMRMDINRMSYEEMVALGERIGKVNTGVKTSELSKFVKKVICCKEKDEEERCVICLEQYADADVKGQLKCNHQYHFSCIGKWMEEQAVCPICRQRATQFEQ